MQLFVRGPELCDCGSRDKRMRCCHSMAPAEEGGIVWYAVCAFSHQLLSKATPETK